MAPHPPHDGIAAAARLVTAGKARERGCAAPLAPEVRAGPEPLYLSLTHTHTLCRSVCVCVGGARAFFFLVCVCICARFIVCDFKSESNGARPLPGNLPAQTRNRKSGRRRPGGRRLGSRRIGSGDCRPATVEQGRKCSASGILLRIAESAGLTEFMLTRKSLTRSARQKCSAYRGKSRRRIHGARQ